jgi:HJR/Mrr/RecB family endonuclease
MNPVTVFTIGELYTHEEVYRSLQVGNAGGIRPCINPDGSVRRLVLMTAEATGRTASENPYHDRVEGDVLVYTAAGREGQQRLAGSNRRLLDQVSVPYPIYGFVNIGSRRDKALGQRRWRFLGLLQYLRSFTEAQPDIRAAHREAQVFELFIHRDPASVPIAHDYALSVRLCAMPYAATAAEEAERSIARPESIGTTDTTHAGHLQQVEAIRRALLTLHPERFEHVVKDALAATGFTQASVTRYSADGGIDINAYAGAHLWPYRDSLLQVQAKRWLHTVGRREVAELRGSLQLHAHGAIVTTSFFTKAAIIEAAEAAKKPIVLVNGVEFAGVLARLGHTENDFVG